MPSNSRRPHTLWYGARGDPVSCVLRSELLDLEMDHCLMAAGGAMDDERVHAGIQAARPKRGRDHALRVGRQVEAILLELLALPNWCLSCMAPIGDDLIVAGI